MTQFHKSPFEVQCTAHNKLNRFSAILFFYRLGPPFLLPPIFSSSWNLMKMWTELCLWMCFYWLHKENSEETNKKQTAICALEKLLMIPSNEAAHIASQYKLATNPSISVHRRRFQRNLTMHKCKFILKSDIWSQVEDTRESVENHSDMYDIYFLGGLRCQLRTPTHSIEMDTPFENVSNTRARTHIYVLQFMASIMFSNRSNQC